MTSTVSHFNQAMRLENNQTPDPCDARFNEGVRPKSSFDMGIWARKVSARSRMESMDLDPLFAQQSNIRHILMPIEFETPAQPSSSSVWHFLFHYMPFIFSLVMQNIANTCWTIYAQATVIATGNTMFMKNDRTMASDATLQMEEAEKGLSKNFSGFTLSRPESRSASPMNFSNFVLSADSRSASPMNGERKVRFADESGARSCPPSRLQSSVPASSCEDMSKYRRGRMNSDSMLCKAVANLQRGASIESLREEDTETTETTTKRLRVPKSALTTRSPRSSPRSSFQNVRLGTMPEVVEE